MARVTYGAIITDISGSIGGTTFQQNRSGKIARLRPGNPKAKTPKQSKRMQRFSETGANWKQLTLPQKILWNDFAAANPKTDTFGQLKTLTGYSMFLSLNYWRLELGNPVLTVPPAFVLPAPVVDFNWNLLIDQISETSVVYASAPNLTLIQYTTPPVLTQTKSNFNKMIFSFIGTALPPFPKDITAAWNFTTGLDYLTLRASSVFQIAAMFQVLDINTGITSQGLFKTFNFK